MKLMRKKWKLLLPIAVAVALLVPLVAIPATASDGEWEVKIVCNDPCDSCSVGAITVQVPGSGAGDIPNDGKFVPRNIPFDWKVKGYGYTSQTYTQSDDSKILQVDGSHLCCMDIEVPDDIAADARVRIKGAGDQWKDDECICLPKSVDITWSLILGKFESQTYTKHVDCTPLVVREAAQPSYCLMEIKVPHELMVRVENSGQAWGNGEKISLPVSNTVNWRVEAVNGKFVGEWYQKHVDCTPLEVLPCHWCAMRILMPYDLEKDGRVRILDAGDQWTHGEVIYLPKCIFINWSLITDVGTGEYEGPVQKKHIDCTPLEAGCAPTFCNMHIEMPQALQDVGAVIRIKDSNTDFEHCDTVTLPVSEDIEWRLVIEIGSGRYEGPWNSKHVDCTPLVVPTDAYCVFTAKPPKGSLLRLKNSGTDFARGDTLILPKYMAFAYSVDGGVTWVPRDGDKCNPTTLN